MSRLEYSTELEEIAYSKDSQALFKAADAIIGQDDMRAGRRESAFFEAGSVLKTDCHWFTWWYDNQTALLFRGDYASVNKKIRKLIERAERA